MDDRPGPEPADEDGAGAGDLPVGPDEGGREESDLDAGDDVGDDTEAGDGGDGGADHETAATKDPLRFNSWMKRSATGAVMTGIAVGLQQALELPRQEPAFVIEASGEPEDPNRPIDLRFDPDSPANTVAIIRRPAPEPSDEGSTEPT